MKKTCNGCRALRYGIIHNYCWECGLGYDIDITKGIPKEQCPKPRTIAELVKLGRNSNE
jgi:hypothetical protein